ncbi:hypothetical protein J6590_006333 [Homalodisca vitripennis]|nr:hypothetical protein J6590_006333 [Homalodisca vitripennis]
MFTAYPARRQALRQLGYTAAHRVHPSLCVTLASNTASLKHSLESYAVRDMKFRIKSLFVWRDSKKSAMKNFKMNSLRRFDVSLMSKRCREYVLSFFVADCFGSLQIALSES